MDIGRSDTAMSTAHLGQFPPRRVRVCSTAWGHYTGTGPRPCACATYRQSASCHMFVLQHNRMCGEHIMLGNNNATHLHSLVVCGYASVSQTQYGPRCPDLYIPNIELEQYTVRLQARRVDRRTSSATRSSLSIARGIPWLEVAGLSVARPPHPCEATHTISAIVSDIRVVDNMYERMRVG